MDVPQIEGGLNQAFPTIQETGEVDAERVRLGCRSSGSPLAGLRQISATKRRLLHSTTGGGATLEGSCQCKKQG